MHMLTDAVLTPCTRASRFRPNMVSIEAETLFEYMRSHSSHLHDATQKALMANLKRFLAEQSELPDPEGEACRAAGATKSAFGGRTSFSPKKPKGPDARPAILARKTRTINIDRKRGLVTVGGDANSFQHTTLATLCFESWFLTHSFKAQFLILCRFFFARTK